MTDAAAPAPVEPAPNQFSIEKLYLKDTSFEAPNSPAVFAGAWEPDINLQLGTGARSVAEHVYEVVLSLTVTAKLSDKTAYLVEVHQAGLFMMQGFSERDSSYMLGSYCPNLLFSFAREAIAGLVGKGGFPALYLTPMNFDALYAQRLQQQQAPPAEPAEAAPTTH